MSDSHRSENDDFRFENKIKKKIKNKSRRETKVNLENIKYILDNDDYYDIIDDMEE